MSLKVTLPVLKPIPFARHNDCRKCELWNGCESVGVPGRLFAKSTMRNPTTALIIVGEAPGRTEDQLGECFVGRSGQKLETDYIDPFKLTRYADIYATNTVRCLPQSDKPTASQIKKCHPYLLDDIDAIAKKYKTVLILAAGSYAVNGLTGRSLTEQFKYPFEELSICTSTNNKVFMFATYHPAYILRFPHMQKVANTHMSLVAEWLQLGSISYEKMPIPERAPVCTPENFNKGDIVEFDLETYGFIKHERNQTVYHPRKMVAIDHKQPHNIIYTIHIAWVDPKGNIRCGWFVDRNKVHRERFWEWLRKAGIIGGQNIQFDAKLIRYCHGESKLPVWKPLMDTMVETFLYDDLQPRSLKAIVPLYRITDYNDEIAEQSKDVKIYSGVSDKKLIHYGCKDAWCSLRCKHVAWIMMKRMFSSHPNARNKTTRLRIKKYSEIIWSAILLEEAGVPYSAAAMLKARDEAEKIRDSSVAEAQSKYNYALIGPGSDGSKRQLFADAINEILAELNHKADNGIEVGPSLKGIQAIESIPTTKTGKVKADANTRNMLQGLATPGSKASIALALLSECSGACKLLNTYIDPRLYGKELKTKRYRKYLYRHNSGELKLRKEPIGHKFDYRLQLVWVKDKRGRFTGVGMSYPTWFIIPKGEEKGRGGGVRQFRWSAKDHGVQTDPKPIKACMTSRYRHGIIAAADYSQKEWRMAAFIANDKVMLDEIARDLDPHVESASFLLGTDLTHDSTVRKWLHKEAMHTLVRCPNYKMRMTARKYANYGPRDYPVKFVADVVAFCRQEVGKSPNFAYVYGAYGETIQTTVRWKSGFDVALQTCYGMINRNDKKYDGLVKLREQLTNEALQYGAIHLPILGMTRTFTDDEEAILGQYRGQVYDLEIQALSGLDLQFGIIATQKVQIKEKLPFKVCLNNHDAAYGDFRWDVARQGLILMIANLKDNWFVRQLEAHFGRKFPMKVKAELIATRGVNRGQAEELIQEINSGK